ncbi:MAG TPA: hypothetical protein VJL58_10540 [Pyrinomonadaceae bacterium]|nr:hypothetical protein [Pyrinomonadaceae bacterium]
MRLLLSAIALSAALFSGCQKNVAPGGPGVSAALKNVSAVGLNFRYEADVPQPAEPAKPAQTEAGNPAIQADFEQNRRDELLDGTITSPDSKRILAVYHRPGDQPSEFRLDMYTADGKVLRRVTPDSMAVHFRETIRWAPDASAVAFVATTRAKSDETQQQIPAAPAVDPSELDPIANVGTNAAPNQDANMAVPAETPLPAPETVLTFQSEQIYLCGADGDNLRALTQNEGLIYFYYVWSQDSTMLAALAATSREWGIMFQRAELAGEVFTPIGRPRLIERNGRERRLDDGLTKVQPVWSPDSSKVAAAFDTQVRIYDAGGNPPTQAAIPLRNQLLLSSQAYERQQAEKLNAPVDSNAQPPANSNSAQQPTTLPDPNTLVSFNPIVTLNWASDDLLYLETAAVKRMKIETDSAINFARWHRLVLSAQPGK